MLLTIIVWILTLPAIFISSYFLTNNYHYNCFFNNENFWFDTQTTDAPRDSFLMVFSSNPSVCSIDMYSDILFYALIFQVIPPSWEILAVLEYSDNLLRTKHQNIIALFFPKSTINFFLSPAQPLIPLWKIDIRVEKKWKQLRTSVKRNSQSPKDLDQYRGRFFLVWVISVCLVIFTNAVDNFGQSKFVPKT